MEKAKTIRLLILDVDGVLTTGKLFIANDGSATRSFHVHDGLGIKLLQKSGVEVAVISAKNSEAVAARLKALNIKHCYLGQENKLPAYEELKQKLGLSDAQIAYMGDDLPDLPQMRRAGFALTVPASPLASLQVADYITKKKAGKGAVREACELILKAQKTWDSVVESYFTQ